MTKIVIDSNIAFSAMLNVNSRIGQMLINGSKHFKFYAPEYIQHEISTHKDKIKLIAGFDEESFRSVYNLVFKDVEIINHALMPQEHLLKMIELYGSIDMDDVVFIALANFVDGLLWTGDKQLINGLNKKGFLKTISTDELFVSFLKIELQKR